MAGDTFKKLANSLVTTLRVEGVTSSAPGKLHQVPAGATVKIFPTSAGTATVYSTHADRELSDLDTTTANVTGSTNADWLAWEAGAVTVSTSQQALGPVRTVAVAVASGTWTLEVSA